MSPAPIPHPTLANGDLEEALQAREALTHGYATAFGYGAAILFAAAVLLVVPVNTRETQRSASTTR